MTPQLRFPEFTDEWQMKTIKDLYAPLRSNSLSRDKLNEVGIVKNIHYGDIHKSLPSHIDLRNVELPSIIDNTPLNDPDYIQNGDLVIADASEDYADIGKTVEVVNTNKEVVLAGLHTIPLRSKGDVALGFGAYLMSTSYVHNQMRKIANGISVLGISKTSLANTAVALPFKPEQEKIAEFLTAVDERIATGEKKLELLQKYKKGVMQKIFTQQIRFKGENGNSYPEWEEKRLGDVGTTYAGLTGKSGSDFGSGANYVTYMQIFSDSKIDVTMFSQVQILPNERQNKAEQGDIFFTTSSETPQEVGYASVMLDSIDDVYLNSFCFGYRADKATLAPEFARYFFHSQGMRIVISRLAQGSTRFNLSKNELMKLPVRLPKLEEQQKIATFLTALDDKIAAEQTRLTAAKQWKKGLLQRMFI